MKKLPVLSAHEIIKAMDNKWNNIILSAILMTILVSTVQAAPEQIEYNYYFGLYPNNQQLIERYGTLPVFETEEQRENWNSNLEELSDTIKEDFASQYIYPYGDVVTCGTNSKGYFVVLFRNENINEKVIENIYSFIDSAANNKEILDIPVEFGYGDYPYLFAENISTLTKTEIKSTSNYFKSGWDMNVTEIPTLAVYGDFPKWEDEEEFNNWVEKLGTIRENIGYEVMRTGKVEWYGGISNKKSFNVIIRVAISKGLSEEEKITQINAIYAIIDDEARKENVSNVPVVFFEDEIIPLEEVENLNVNTETSIAENETLNTTNKTVPGFSVLTLIIVISLILKFRY